MHLTIALRVAVYQKCATIEEEGKRKVNKAMLDETAVYEAVKEILACNKRNRMATLYERRKLFRYKSFLSSYE